MKDVPSKEIIELSTRRNLFFDPKLDN